MTAPNRIWIWPEQSATGNINWLKGCFRAEPHRPLDDKDGPTGAAYVPAAVADDLLDELENLLEAITATDRFGDRSLTITGPTANLKWLLEAEDDARAAIAKARGQA